MISYYSSIKPSLPHDCIVSSCRAASPLDKKPSVILLGEFHGHENNYIANAFLINKLYKPGDVVLMEFAGIPPKWFVEERFLALDNMNIQGWDDKTADDEIMNVKYSVHRLFKEVESSSLYNPLWDPRIEFFIEDFEQDERGLLEEDLQKIKASFRDVKKNRGQSTDKKHCVALSKTLPLLNITYSRHSKSVKNILSSTFSRRQVSLATKISQFAKQNNTVFVIAGEAHILTEEEMLSLMDKPDGWIGYLGSGIITTAKASNPMQTNGIQVFRSTLRLKEHSFHMFSCVGASSEKMNAVTQAMKLPLEKDPLERGRRRPETAASWIFSCVRTWIMALVNLIEKIVIGLFSPVRFRL